MVTLAKPLMQLCAADIMSSHVVMVPEAMSLEGAARLLTQAEVTGAPVVDGEGRVIGVISATDFVHWAEGRRTPKHASACTCTPWEIIDESALPSHCVGDFMTADPVTVNPGMRLAQVAQLMLDAHIHRVIVVDDNRRPLGIVSSTDILAAVARADTAPAGRANWDEPSERLYYAAM